MQALMDRVSEAPISRAAHYNESAHEDRTAKLFLVSSISYFFIVGIVALIIAAKFVWPSLMGTIPMLTY